MTSSASERKHFFTGRQVTTMVVALMATIVMLPGAVWAVDTFTNVAIQDPVSGKKAQVNGARQLAINGNVKSVDRTVVANTGAKDLEVRGGPLVTNLDVSAFRSVVVLLDCSPHSATTDCNPVDVSVEFRAGNIITTTDVSMSQGAVTLDFPEPRGTTLTLNSRTPVEHPVAPTLQWTVLGRAN